MHVLTISQSYAADQEALKSGVSGRKLMESAGQAVAKSIFARWDKCPVAILCGPGNNGGDGFVVARLLKKAGWPVTVYLPVDKSALKGDAAANAKRWRMKVRTFETALEDLTTSQAPDNLLIVDAIFGAGLSKPLKGPMKTLALWLNHQRLENRAPAVVSVDIPSGLHGDSGQPLAGIAFQADLTVTFCRPKPAHFLMPGRDHCGEIVVGDIGISDQVVAELNSQTFHNGPDMWMGAFPTPDSRTHKYSRGHLVVLGGDNMCGAAHLASMAARRMGAGLVSIAISQDVTPLYISSVQPGTLLASFKGLKGFRKVLSDSRKTTCVLGPGAGLSALTAKKVMAAVQAKKACVLDADALTVFQNDSKSLFKLLKKSSGDIVLTPHGGEFQRLFPDLAKKQGTLGKLEATRKAAKRAGCVIIYKGPDTVIASPDGRAALSDNAPSTLATAGTGDVLAGFVGGLLAQHMPTFEAACAAVWLHGECANIFGPGLIAEDLTDMLPEALINLFESF